MMSDSLSKETVELMPIPAVEAIILVRMVRY
jgi:hypothetical protein